MLVWRLRALRSPGSSAHPPRPAAAATRAGDKVTAGTVNYDGQITVQAVHSGGDTGEHVLRGGANQSPSRHCSSARRLPHCICCMPSTLVLPLRLRPAAPSPAAVADIVRLVESAQSRTAPVQRFADVVAVRPFLSCRSGPNAPLTRAKHGPGTPPPLLQSPALRPASDSSCAFPNFNTGQVHVRSDGGGGRHLPLLERRGHARVPAGAPLGWASVVLCCWAAQLQVGAPAAAQHPCCMHVQSSRLRGAWGSRQAVAETTHPCSSTSGACPVCRRRVLQGGSHRPAGAAGRSRRGGPPGPCIKLISASRTSWPSTPA